MNASFKNCNMVNLPCKAENDAVEFSNSISFATSPQKIVFATTNKRKIYEMNYMKVFDKFDVHYLDEFAIDDLPETGNTLIDNAIQKAQESFKLTGLPSFADDTGIFINALNGYPGIFSNRVAGADKDFYKVYEEIDCKLKALINQKADQDAKTDQNLKNHKSANILQKKQYDDSCYFATAVAFVSVDMQIVFEERLNGRFFFDPVSVDKCASGYNSIFIPDGFDKTFSKLGDEVYIQIIPRVAAVRRVLEVI